MHPLIGIPSPRDIPEFLSAIALIHDDKIWAKYHTEFDAYCILRNFFLEHTEYTHLVIIPDDLIVTRSEYEYLKEQVKNYPVFSGTCNLDLKSENKDLFICKLDWNKLDLGIGYLTRAELDRLPGVQEMAFEGFACCFIRRDVVEKVPFVGSLTCGYFDRRFAYDCKQLDIPLMVDTSIRMHHRSCVKGYYELENCGVDLFEPQVIYEKRMKTKYEWLKSA